MHYKGSSKAVTTTTAVIGMLVILVAVFAGTTYYYYTLYNTASAVKTVSLLTKAGLWADFYRELEVVERFEERMWTERGIIVKVRHITAPHTGYADKVIIDFAAGVAADVVYQKPELIGDMVEAGWLLDLTPYVENWADWDQFYDVSKESVTYEGSVYGGPTELGVHMLFYRIDLFEDAGITTPWQPETWDDILDAATTVKEALPDVTPIKLWYGVADWIYGAGGRRYDPADNKLVVKSQQLLDILEYQYDASVELTVNPPAMYWEKWDSRKMFADGELAMCVDGVFCWREKWGPGMPTEIPDIEDKVGYAILPGSGKAGAPEYWSPIGAYSYMINAEAEEPDLAFELLKEMIAPDVAAEWNYRTSHLVTRADAVTGAYADDPFLVWATDITEFATLEVPIEGWKKFADLYWLVVKDYLLTGDYTPEWCMDKFAELCVAELGADAVKALPPYEL